MTIAIMLLAAALAGVGCILAIDGARRLRANPLGSALVRPTVAAAELCTGVSLIGGVVMATLEIVGALAS
jgi:hypothetical protein